MRCPKCNSPIAIGGEVCKNCNYNVYTKQYVQLIPEPKPMPKPEFEITGNGELIAYNGTAEHIVIPANVCLISKPVFSGNSRIHSVTIGNGLTGLGRDVFKDCTQLQQVELPGSLRVLNLTSFSGCYNLKRIRAMHGLQQLVMGDELSRLPALTLELPDSITSMTWSSMKDSERTQRMKSQKIVVASENFYQKFSDFFAQNPDFVCTRTGRHQEPVPVPPAPKPKPKKKFWKQLIITVLACLIGREIGHAVGSWTAQRELSGRSPSRPAIEEKVPETQEAEEVSPEFQKFLQSHGILRYDPNIKDKNVECFAIDQGDGIFEFMEFGYSGDTIREFRDMIYIPLSGMSSSEKDAFVNHAKQQFAPHATLRNCTLTYDQSEYYLVVMLTYQDVHKSANIRAMTDMGIIEKDHTTGQYATSVSLSKTRADLLANGAVQR